MNVEIAHLYQYPSLRPAVAQLIYDTFWRDKPGYHAAYFEERLGHAVDSSFLPLSRVAVAGGQVVGTVNLIDNDDDKRTHLWPWLAALVVVDDWRHRGIGTRLVRTLLADCGRMGIDSLYLGTDGPGFYQRLGAVVHETVRPDFCILRFDRLKGSAER